MEKKCESPVGNKLLIGSFKSEYTIVCNVSLPINYSNSIIKHKKM